MLHKRSNQTAGYTTIELLVIVVIVAILAAMAAPGWLGFLTRQRLNAAQAEATVALREVQANAKREKRVWQACFRDDGTRVMWAVRPRPLANGQAGCNTATNWQNITQSDADKIAIDNSRSTSELLQNGSYRIEFEHKGLLSRDPVTGRFPLGTITFIARGQPNSTGRCVAIETILGTTRVGTGDECRLPTPQP